MGARFGAGRGREILSRWWRTIVVDECPEARADRLRRKQISDLRECRDLFNAMHLWEAENRKRHAGPPNVA